MRFNSLDDWLIWQESLNPKEIDLGLERVSQVLLQLGLKNTFDCPLITVAGTNGKGSLVAIIEAIALSAGLKVCSYTSPHLFKYNERIKINSQPINDIQLCESFQRIDEARKCLAEDIETGAELPLTYFEFGTLAAIDIAHRADVDLVILEVGLGGRLDAVNIMDADVSVITSIGIDHIDWLGDNRELIGYEKAGIFREKQAVICGESDAPVSLLNEAKKKQCSLFLLGRDYKVNNIDENTWQLKSTQNGNIESLPTPNLIGDFQKNNAATAIMAFQVLLKDKKLQIANQYPDLLAQALTQIKLSGRFHCIRQKPRVYVDVAHNPQAALTLASQLKQTRTSAVKTWAIVALLADKDAGQVLASLVDEVDFWCFSGIELEGRGRSAAALFNTVKDKIFGDEKAVFTEKNQRDLARNQCTMLTETMLLSESVKVACDMVLSKAGSEDRIIIFGSFYTVAEAMQFFSDDKYV